MRVRTPPTLPSCFSFAGWSSWEGAPLQRVNQEFKSPTGVHKFCFTWRCRLSVWTSDFHSDDSGFDSHGVSQGLWPTILSVSGLYTNLILSERLRSSGKNRPLFMAIAAWSDT